MEKINKIDIIKNVAINVDVEHATDEEIIGYAFYAAQFGDNKETHVEEFKCLINRGLAWMIRNMFEFVEGYKDYMANDLNISLSNDRRKKGLECYNKYFA